MARPVEKREARISIEEIGSQQQRQGTVQGEFYEIKIRPSEILVRIEPPASGKHANLNEIQKKLGELDVTYRMDHLFDIYRRASNEFETLAKRESNKYEINLEIAPGGYEAHMTITPPDRGDDELTPGKIKDALENAGVEKGILYDQIKRIMAENIQGERVLVAKGKPPIHGEEGWLEFNPDDQADKGVTVEENRADYKELNLVKSVEDGFVIATVFPPTMGEDGYDITGKVIKGKNGKKAKFRLGSNATMSEDGSQILAGKSGFVVFSGEKISVEDVLEVENVDSETGNIRFTGVVRVKGQVEDGFTVEGRQGIEVLGTVGKAVLNSQGDIHVYGGILGGNVTTPKTLRAKFLSECRVEAGLHVLVDEYILHCELQAGKVVHVTKPVSGFITGGTVRAGLAVWGAALGSEASEEATKIEVGVQFNLKRKFEDLDQQIVHNREIFDKLRKNIRVLQAHKETKNDLPADKEQTLHKMIDAAWKLQARLQDSSEEFHRLHSAVTQDSKEGGYVFASNGAHPGTSIQIKRLRFNVRSTLKSCAFRIQGDELKARDFGEVQRYFKVNHGKMPG